MGGGSRFAGLVLGRGLTLLPPDAAAAAVGCVANGSDAAAQVKLAVGRPFLVDMMSKSDHTEAN